jgi:phosphoribosylanthranilate isomerase
MVRIKIYGITSLEEASAAIAAGADMLGFNFYRPSPRFITPQDARTIIEALRAEIKALSRTVTMVGVFVNEPAESIARIAAEAGIAAIQLHGDETVEFCRELKALLPDRFLIKALRARGDDVIEHAVGYNVGAIMLDAFDAELRGGTGRAVDWHLAQHVREAVPRLFLAGGLSLKTSAQRSTRFSLMRSILAAHANRRRAERTPNVWKHLFVVCVTGKLLRRRELFGG